MFYNSKMVCKSINVGYWMTLFLFAKRFTFHRQMKYFGELYDYPKKGAPCLSSLMRQIRSYRFSELLDT